MASKTANIIEDLIKGELNWHEKINNNFHNLNSRLSQVASAASEAASAVTEMSGKLEADTIAKKDSTKLITSGAAYKLTEDSYRDVNESSGNYESFINYVRPFRQSIYMVSEVEQYFNNNGKIMHRTMKSNVNPQCGTLLLSSTTTLRPDNTDNSRINESCYLRLSGSSLTMDMKRGDSPETNLQFYPSRMETQDSGIYDIGSSSSKFRNIYATTGTIQTSDANEKKNVNTVDAELASKIIMGLNPVSFKFIDGTSDRTHYGLIAQEVEELVNGLGIDNKDFAALTKSQKTVRKVEKKPIGKDENGETKYIEESVDKPVEGEYVYGLRYDEFTAILVKMCQILQGEVNELKSEVAALKNN